MSKFKINLLLILSALSTCFGMQAAGQRVAAAARGLGRGLARGPKEMPKAPKGPLSMTVRTPRMPAVGSRGMATMGAPRAGAQGMLGAAGTSPLQQRLQMEGQFGGAPARGMATRSSWDPVTGKVLKEESTVREKIKNVLEEEHYLNVSDVQILDRALDLGFKSQIDELMKEILINSKDGNGNTILHWRPYMPVEPEEEYFFNNYAKRLVNVKGRGGNTPLMFLVGKTSFKHIEKGGVRQDPLELALSDYFDAGADPNTENDFGMTPLSLAVANGNFNAVEQLLKYNSVVVNHINKDKKTALDFAYEALPTMLRAFTIDKLYSFGETKDIIKALEDRGATRGKEVSKIDELREGILLGDSPEKIYNLLQKAKLTKDNLLEMIGFYTTLLMQYSKVQKDASHSLWKDSEYRKRMGKSALKSLTGIAVGLLTLAAVYKKMKPSAEEPGQDTDLIKAAENVSEEIIAEVAPDSQMDIVEEFPAQGQEVVEEEFDTPVLTAETPTQAVEQPEETGLAPFRFGEWAAWATGNERLKDPAVQQQVWDEAKAKTYETLVSSPYRKARSWAGYDQ